MDNIGLGCLFAVVIIWAIFDYYTKVDENVSKWIRRVLWGPGSVYIITLLKVLPLLSFGHEPVKLMALTYCFLLVFVSIPSLYFGHWAIESYNRKAVRKSVIISGTNWVFGLCVSIYIFHFVMISQKAGY